jgi:hypothetical protein
MDRTAICLTVVIGLSACAAARAQAPYGDEATRGATTAAQQGLQTYVRLVTPDNYQAMGFTNPDDVRSAVLGPPLRVFTVRLDELKAYGGGDPGALLEPTERVTFLVQVGGATRSTLTVERRAGTWTAASFGAPRYGKLVDEVRSRLVEPASAPPEDLFEVRVPALNVGFVGSRSGGALFLTPIVDDPRFGFERGGTLPAVQALQAMVTAAREHNGLPT